MFQPLVRNKIIIFFGALIAIITPSYASLLAQNIDVVKTLKRYHALIKQDSMQKMVELKSLIPHLSYDLRYGSSDNFMQQKLYSQSKKTYLRLPVVKALNEIQTELKQMGYNLKIFDAYRPYSITQKMWDLVHDERYVANPSKGSAHNRGLAVDLTIIDLQTGKELDMGTGFDNFTDSAHHDFLALPGQILQNRTLLKTLMMKNGFKPLPTEWWHYSWPNDKNYVVLDLSFKALSKQ